MALQRRASWVKRISRLDFRTGPAEIQAELEGECSTDVEALDEHLLTCGAIPEGYPHDSTAEKLYSKYTDCVLAIALKHIGLESEVIATRADSADVYARAPRYDLAADAKAFRLSRTAKNQKDFKVEAMAAWKGTASEALVVGPLYQFPKSSSQIYRQAVRSRVLVISNEHLSALARLAAAGHDGPALLAGMFAARDKLSPTKSAAAYWGAIRMALVTGSADREAVWQSVLQRSHRLLAATCEFEAKSLVAEIEHIKHMPHDRLADELVQARKLPQRLVVVRRASKNALDDY